MTSEYTRAQLRELLVEFYTRVDPGRLAGGRALSSSRLPPLVLVLVRN